MILTGMVMSDWISIVMCSCGHLAKRHKLHPPPLGQTNSILGSCKDCPPFDPAEISGCDGFTPQTMADTEKFIRARGIVNPTMFGKMMTEAEEVMAMDLPEVDMSRNLAATFASARQPEPHGTGREITPLVIADLEERREFGKAKYGEGLTAFNGRNALYDAYQEAIDLVVYLRQMIEEAANE